MSFPERDNPTDDLKHIPHMPNWQNVDSVTGGHGAGADDEIPTNDPESEYWQRRLTGERLQYISPESQRYPEMLEPRAVKVFGGEFRGEMVDQYYDQVEQISPHIVKDIHRRARDREAMLERVMGTEVYTFTPEEEKAGLKPKADQEPIWTDIPTSFIVGMSDGSVTIDNSTGKKYWVVKDTDPQTGNTREKRYLYGDNREYRDTMEQISSDMKVPIKLFVGIERPGVSVEDAEKKRLELAAAIREQRLLQEALDSLLEKTHEQDLFAGSDEGYLKQRFLRVGKVIVMAAHYRDLFNAIESRDGLAPAGEKLQEGLAAWLDIVQNRAVVEVTIEDPNDASNFIKVKRVMPNSYAYAKNNDLRDLNTKYAEKRIEQKFASTEKKPVGAETEANFKRFQEADNRRAARLAAIFTDHFDMDSAHPFDIIWDKDGKIINIVQELAWNDSGKLAHPMARILKEKYGKLLVDRRVPSEDRVHPRVHGSDMTIWTLPELSGSFLEVTGIQVRAVNKATGEEGTVNLTIDQIAFGAKDREDNRITFERGGKKYSQVTRAKKAGEKSDRDVWEYEVKGLGWEEIWDSIQVLVPINGEIKAVGTDNMVDMAPVNVDHMSFESIRKTYEKLDFIMGTTADATEIPKGLLEMYAWNAIYNEFTRSDFSAQYEEYSSKDPNRLMSLSKQFGSGLGLLAAQHQLSNDTSKRLEEFLRISLIARVLADNIKEDSDTPDRHDLQSGIQQLDSPLRRAKEGNLVQAALHAEFIRRSPNSNEDGTYRWGSQKDLDLFNYLIENRYKGPNSPWDVPGYFSKEQLEELKPLYSLMFMGSSK